jgi:hypothetical protein
VYTKDMAAIKKTVKTSIHTAVAEPDTSLEEAVSREEKRPAVTQVVEVVEEVPRAQPQEDLPKEEIAQKADTTPPPVSDMSPVASADADVEKRKELVDEIFQKDGGESQIMPEISMHRKRRTPSLFFWAIGVVAGCLVIGAVLLFMTGKTGSLPSVVVVPTPTPTQTVQPTPASASGEIKRDAITIQVLNGGGKAGAATKMKQFLEDKGYTVSDTGNAESYTYTKTEVQVKAAKKAYIALLEGDLKGTYSLGTSSAALDETASVDARVIVGKE